MSKDLPKGWKSVPLGEVAEIKGGIQKGKKRREGTPVKNVPYLRVANVQRGHLDLREVSEVDATESEIEALRLQAGDVLLNEGGDPDKLGRGWVWQEELPLCIHQNHVFRARPHPAVLDPKFLSLFANGPGQKYFLSQAKQTTGIASISSKQLHAFPVHMPPLEEQCRIVARIEELTARSTTAKQALQAIPPLLEKFRQSVLAAAFRGDLTAEWRLRLGTPAPGGVKSSNIGRRLNTPKGWQQVSLAEVTEIKGGIQKGKKRDGKVVTVSVPYLRVANVKRGYLDLSEVSSMAATETEIELLRLKAGDVLLNEGGDPDKLGRGWIWNDELPVCIHQNHVFRARPNSKFLNSRFLAYYANGPGQAYFLSQAKQTTGIASISRKQLDAFSLPLPPLPEQVEIVRIIDQLLEWSKSVGAQCQGAWSQQESFDRSLLAKAFRGELVPNDFEDSSQTPKAKL